MPRKVPKPGAVQKYPFADMEAGHTVSLFFRDRAEEIRMRKAASTLASTKGWKITGTKLDTNLISFVRVE